MPICEQQRVRIAHPCSDYPQVAGSVEQTRIPALPVRQQFLDVLPEIHRLNVYEPMGRDNDRTRIVGARWASIGLDRLCR